MIYLNNKSFGKCEIICHFKEVAIIELENNIEKYVVAIGFSIKNGNWIKGIYCKNLKDAGKIFNSILEDFYMVLFKI